MRVIAVGLPPDRACDPVDPEFRLLLDWHSRHVHLVKAISMTRRSGFGLLWHELHSADRAAARFRAHDFGVHRAGEGLRVARRTRPWRRPAWLRRHSMSGRSTSLWSGVSGRRTRSTVSAMMIVSARRLRAGRVIVVRLERIEPRLQRCRWRKCGRGMRRWIGGVIARGLERGCDACAERRARKEGQQCAHADHALMPSRLRSL